MFGTQPLGQDFPSPKGESKTRCATSFAVRGHLQKACWWCWLVMAGCHKVDWATNATEFKKKKSLRIQTSSINISFCLNPHSPSQGFTLLSAGICLASPFVTLSTWLACVAAASPLPRPSCSYFHYPVPPPLLPRRPSAVASPSSRIFIHVCHPPSIVSPASSWLSMYLTHSSINTESFYRMNETLRWLFHGSLSCKYLFRYFHLLCGSKGRECILEAKSGKMCWKVGFPYIFLCWRHGSMGEKLRYRSSSSVVESFPLFSVLCS